jgi:ferric-dicitrate binding protein FerR (iron transport regulator)
LNSELILKHLSGHSSDEEIEQLTKWVNENAENENQFAEMQNSYIFLASTLSPDNQKSAFNEIINQINNKKEKKGISVKRIYSIAASILFPVLLGAFAWFYQWSNSGNEPELFTEIVAPPKHNSQITLSDGTQVWLSPESKLRYGQNYGRETRNVILDGEGYFEVAKNQEKPFTVETGLLKVRVLGTSFNLEAYSNETMIRTTLVRGSLQIESELISKGILLTPGDRISLDVNSKQLTSEKVNTEIYRLVKDGMIIFKRNTLAEVCRKLERWFMIPVELKGNDNQDLLFTAKFQDESIEKILQILNLTIPINYQIMNDKIVIKQTINNN